MVYADVFITHQKNILKNRRGNMKGLDMDKISKRVVGTISSEEGLKDVSQFIDDKQQVLDNWHEQFEETEYGNEISHL